MEGWIDTRTHTFFLIDKKQYKDQKKNQEVPRSTLGTHAHTYIYMERERERERKGGREGGREKDVIIYKARKTILNTASLQWRT